MSSIVRAEVVQHQDAAVAVLLEQDTSQHHKEKDAKPGTSQNYSLWSLSQVFLTAHIFTLLLGKDV